MNEKTTDRERSRRTGRARSERIWYVGDAFAQGFAGRSAQPDQDRPVVPVQIKEIVEIELWLKGSWLERWTRPPCSS
jgi:carbamoyl-phosphate synthase large subunit